MTSHKSVLDTFYRNYVILGYNNKSGYNLVIIVTQEFALHFGMLYLMIQTRNKCRIFFKVVKIVNGSQTLKRVVQ